MKTLFTLILFLITGLALADSSILAPFREGYSEYVGFSQYSKAQKHFKTNEKEVFTKASEAIEGNLTQDFPTLVNELEEVADTFSSSRDKRSTLTHMIALCRYSHAIDDILYRLLLDFIEAKYPYNEETTPGPAMSLSDYVTKKQNLIKAFMSMTKDHSQTLHNPFPKKDFSFTVGKYRDLSAQEKMFYSFNANQIRQMAKIIDLALNVSDAESVTTTVKFRNSELEPLVLVHSSTDQYRLALRLMKMKKKDLGLTTANIDLIISAYLMGIINSEELSLVTHDKNFYTPEVSMEKKVLKFAGQLALLGLKIHPVTAPYVIVPIIIYNTVNQSKKMKNTIDEDSFIFTLPETK